VRERPAGSDRDGNGDDPDGLALGALFLVAFVKRLRLRANARRYQQLFAQ
jgi:hypothetical protein